MKKIIAISMLIVLGLFLCVSCDMFSKEKTIKDGLYVSGAGNPISYRITGNRIASYKMAGSGLIDIGTFSRNGTTLSVLWDSGKSSTITIKFLDGSDSLMLNGTVYEKYS